MNIIKHLDFYNPVEVKDPIHIIGCGAVGSTVAEMLTRIGFEQLNLYDFDTVSEHNIANQMFVFNDIGELKVVAIDEHLRAINPAMQNNLYPKGYMVNQQQRPLTGYVFLCVDNIDLRRTIVAANLYNPNIRAMFDFRMRLTDAQHYAADWSNHDSKVNLLKTMQFTHAEAEEATPVSACGTSLSIVPTVRTLVSVGITNFINFTKDNTLAKMILVDPFHGILDSFPL